MTMIKLKKLLLKNFKGVKALEVNFNDFTNIYGDNGTGKTTIFDAFTWLLFDKDSKDRKNFEIKTLNSNNETIQGLEHEVSGMLTVEGREITLRKVLREKWAKRKGETTKIFTGNETLYYIDEIPVKQSEFSSKVNSFIDENIFKLITNPLYFSTSLKWQQRREVILQIIGDIASEAIFNYKSSLRELEKLLEDRDIETLRKSLAVRKKRLNEELKAIPYRLDEINNCLQTVDFEGVKSKLAECTKELEALEEKFMLCMRTEENLLKDQRELNALKEKISALELEARQDAQKPLIKLYDELGRCQKEIASLENAQSKLGCEIFKAEDELSELEGAVRALEANWMKTSEEALIIPPDSFLCPTCRRTFEAEDIEAKRLHLYQEFNKSKNKKLKLLEAELKGKKERYLIVEKQLNTLREQQRPIKAKLGELYPLKDKIKERIDNF